MNIVSCLHPVRIRNKYTHEIMYVPCRKCEACRNMRQMEMVNRLQYERRNWKFCLFFTLTYAPEYVPYFRVEREDDDISFTRPDYVYSFSNGLEIHDVFDADGNLYPFTYLSELPEDVRKDKKSIDVINRAFLSDNQFRVVDKRHVQTFIKRLRFHLDKFYDKERIRYFIVSEYGCDKTENFRPHYHGLLFFNSTQFAKDAYKVLCETWKLGFVGASFARHSAASYVAKYVNSLSVYPKIYDTFFAKPFALYSRKPAIGVPQDTDETVKEIIFHGAMDVTMYVKTSVVSVPFWRSLESRYFPKCREFNQISHNERMRRYTPLSRHEFYSKEFAKEASLFITDEMLRDDYVARRVNLLCDLFDVSLDWYVHRIEDYYSTKALLTLSHFYEYQSEIADKSPDSVKQLVNCYPEAVKEFKKWWYTTVLPSVNFNQFGVNEFEVDTYLFRKFDPYFDLRDCEDWLNFDFSKYRLSVSSEYQQFKADSIKRHNDGLKTKKLNSRKGII